MTQHRKLAKLPPHTTTGHPKEFKIFADEDFSAAPLEPPFWIISDTHWFHANIVKYCDRHEQIAALIGPDTAQRIDHNEYMLKRWNETIGPHDPVLHLGDLFMSKRENYRKFEGKIAPHLNGEKYLILGNHDDKKIDYKKLGFQVVEPFRIKYRGWAVEFSHYPSDGMSGRCIRVHGHIHNKGYGGKHGPRQMRKRANVNMSVEMIDYTPQPVTAMLDAEIGRLER